jgi:hypothetical protein
MGERFKDNSRKKLVLAVRKEVTKMMEKTLDFADVACPKDNFKQLRSKILRVGNDCMRNLTKELDGYVVEYDKLIEEFIEFRNKG